MPRCDEPKAQAEDYEEMNSHKVLLHLLSLRRATGQLHLADVD